MPKEIDVVDVIKKGFNAIVKDPTFIVLFALPLIATIAMYAHTGLWEGLMAGAAGLAALFWQSLGLIIAYVIVILILTLLAIAATILKADAMLKRRRLELGAALKLGSKRIGRLFVVEILKGLIILGGLILLVIPGIYFAVRLALAAQACVLEGGIISALSRSWDLTRGRFWEIFVLALLLWVISLVLGIIPYVGDFINYLIMGPVIAIVWTAVFLHIRR